MLESDCVWSMFRSRVHLWAIIKQYGCFVDPRSLAVGGDYEILVSHGRADVADIAQYCWTLRIHFLVAGVIKEVVS